MTQKGRDAMRMDMTVLAVDPGYEQSAYVLWDGSRVIDHAIVTNAALLELLTQVNASAFDYRPVDAVIFEQIESYGMAVGREVFETVFWTGRFYQATHRQSRMPRKAVKLHICGSARATDANIRVALLDRFGGKAAAIGSKKAPGPLYGVKSHEWAALAIAVTHVDQARGIAA